MENNEFRGMNDGIILYILKSGDRHTDELKNIIDELFFEIKVGTLYSVIKRLQTQKHIDEYRSSSDGSRRKYFTLTDQGREFFETEYSSKFTNAPLVEERVARLVQQPIAKKEPKPTTDKKQSLFQEYVKNIQNDEFNSPISDDSLSKITNFDNFKIDDEPLTQSNGYTQQNNNDVFEEVRESVVEENIEIKPSCNPYMPIYNEPKEQYEPKKREIDYDSVTDTSFEYKSVLNDLFPKKNTVEQSFNVYQPYTEDEPEEPYTAAEYSQNSENFSNFDDIYTYAEKDGIKIKTSSDTNRYQGSRILNNLLRFHTSIIWYGLLILEYLILSLFFSGGVSFNGSFFGKVCLFATVVPIISFIVYIVDTRYTVKDLPRFKDVIEIALIISISAIIIIIALSGILEINYKSISDVYYGIIVPCLIAANIPIFIVIKYFLAKLDFYQTI